MADSYIFWKGTSQINGEPILLILTGINSPSQNRKTGPMIQSYILREGILPTEYRKQGAEAICGDCPIKSACYVGSYYLNQIYDGTHREVTKFPLTLLKGRVLRLGAYGDPAAVPYEVWKRLIKWTSGWTGYTHQWKYCDSRFKALCLASVENESLMREAWNSGWKTYRIGLESESPTSEEMSCPYYIFRHKPKLQCLQCQLCRGDSLPEKKGIFVTVHGTTASKKNFEKVRNSLASVPHPSENKPIRESKEYVSPFNKSNQ